jgi:hypothetical protein
MSCEPPACMAFPNGIPEDIMFLKASHDYPYPGDHGLRWELDPSYPFAHEPGPESPVFLAHMARQAKIRPAGPFYFDIPEGLDI